MVDLAAVGASRKAQFPRDTVSIPYRNPRVRSPDINRNEIELILHQFMWMIPMLKRLDGIKPLPDAQTDRIKANNSQRLKKDIQDYIHHTDACAAA